MLFKFTAKLKKGADIKRIEALEAKLADAANLNKYVGMGFARTLQTHFKTLEQTRLAAARLLARHCGGNVVSLRRRKGSYGLDFGR